MRKAFDGSAVREFDGKSVREFKRSVVRWYPELPNSRTAERS